MPVTEVLDRLTAARRLEADSRMFALSASALPNMAKRSDREAVFERVRKMGRSGVVRRDALDLLDDESRVIHIGGMLARHDQTFVTRNVQHGCQGTWADFNPRWVRWLADRGVTQQQAIERHREWHHRTFAEDPFFATARREREERLAARKRSSRSSRREL